MEGRIIGEIRGAERNYNIEPSLQKLYTYKQVCLCACACLCAVSVCPCMHLLRKIKNPLGLIINRINLVF